MRAIAYRMVAIISTMLAACQSGSKIAVVVDSANVPALRLAIPCGDYFNAGTECHWDRALLQSADPKWKLRHEVVRTFGGKEGVLYDVILHVRGVVEPKNFLGGEVRAAHFQVGGEPVLDDYNFYSLAVSDPAATYTMNRSELTVGHYTFPIDYYVTIRIRAGATMTLGAYDSNDIEVPNFQHHVVEGVTFVPQPFDGQFVQIDIDRMHETNAPDQSIQHRRQR